MTLTAAQVSDSVNAVDAGHADPRVASAFGRVKLVFQQVLTLLASAGINMDPGAVAFGNTDGTLTSAIAQLKWLSSVLTLAGNFVSDADDTRDIGTSGNRWANIYATNIHVGGFTFTIQTITTTPVTLVSGSASFVEVDTDTIGSAATVNLPASPATGELFSIDNTGSSGYAVTLEGNGNTIHGGLTSFALDDDESLLFSFNGSEWRVKA